MNIVSFNPGHDGAVVELRNGRLIASVEAEKDSNYRYTPIGTAQLLAALGRLEEPPDVVAVGGWWPGDEREAASLLNAGYRGVGGVDALLEQRRWLGKEISLFSSSHERSHLFCGFGMSPFPQGEPCYALVWEGEIGAFYEIDAELRIRCVGQVLNEPGNRYASIYGLADPTFPKDAPFSRFSDAGKLMALASFSTRSAPTEGERELMEFLLSSPHVQLDLYDRLDHCSYFNVGLDNQEFRNFAGIFSDRVFSLFEDFAKKHLQNGWPLVIAGGCGLNCDWNSKWLDSGLFADVFVPPVANDSGSAIGTAIDAQFHLTGNAKLDWNVYSGLPFVNDATVNADQYDIREDTDAEIADMLHLGLILGWVSGRYEIGPRALGNRSILAAPFDAETTVRLNEIKRREQFRPIAPVCLEDDASRWFGCGRESPYMLYTYRARTESLAAVTHVNGTARLQTVNVSSNKRLHDLLVAFKQLTGFGVLCNTSLNFHGRGCINRLSDLDAYANENELDGFVVDGRTYLRLKSDRVREYRQTVGKEVAH